MVFTLLNSRNVLYWNVLFYLFISIGDGSWAFDGIEMVSSTTEDGMTTVNCTSTHLTSFAVLVDVSGVLSNDVSSSFNLHSLDCSSFHSTSSLHTV